MGEVALSELMIFSVLGLLGLQSPGPVSPWSSPISQPPTHLCCPSLFTVSHPVCLAAHPSSSPVPLSLSLVYFIFLAW